MDVLSCVIGIIGLLLAIFGIFWSIKGQSIIEKVKQNKEQQANKKADEILINGDWQSVFVESNKLKNEYINIKQTGRVIEGTIILYDNNGSKKPKEYKLTGDFKNRILTADYRGKNQRADERGTLILKLVSENILSGHCIFIFNNKEVYDSTYIWIKKECQDITKGTFPFCNTCVGKSDCCCACDAIDMPILLPEEAEAISLLKQMPKEEFCTKKSEHLYQMNRNEAGEKKACVFFHGNHCTIYENRPIDCRMFPFDVRYIDGKYKIGYYPHACMAIPKDKEEIELCSTHMRPLISILYPYLSESTNEVFSQKVSKLDFTELACVDNSL